MVNIIFCGVGGQGVILASKVVMSAAMNEGLDVKESEVHGMAQRGGSVECNVRFGEKIHSPLIRKADADFVVAFEMLEGMRKVEFLKSDGYLFVNSLKIDPVPVVLGNMQYPADIPEWLSKNVKNFAIVETASILKELGNLRVLNIVMLGAVSSRMKFSQESWEKAIIENVKPEFVDLNLRAFNAGRNITS